MPASTLAYRLAVVFLVLGILMGIAMAASQNHAPMPSHAHLNLLGWVTLFLFGLYYERRPALEFSRLARLQVVVWALATLVLAAAVAAIHLGHTEYDPVAAIASIVLLADVLLFARLLFRTGAAAPSAGAAGTRAASAGPAGTA